ncbi:MAG: ClpXP protease specificity-enhancing factor SspB [Nitrospirota bacterium]|jgi:hypothetical protein
MRALDELKRDVFYRFLEQVGRAFVHVRHSSSVMLGRRGFVGQEREQGIVLVLNSQMKLTWDEEGIKATLVFGSAPEKCFIPSEDIIAVYSPELGAQLTFSPLLKPGEEEEPAENPEAEDNVIKVDFTKGRP